MYKDIPLEEQIEDMKKVVNTYDALNELTKIQEEEGLYDNEGSDIYTEKELEELKDWDVTLMDGLEEEPEIEVKMSGEPSLDVIQEEIHSEEKLLSNPGISAWRKKKIRDYLDGKTKSYW
jgi:hypothetical protein